MQVKKDIDKQVGIQNLVYGTIIETGNAPRRRSPKGRRPLPGPWVPN
jgi:hypothetical protein